MILDEIVEKTKQRVIKRKQEYPLEKIKSDALNRIIYSDFPFEKTLRKQDMAFILEVKRASPSKGLIAADFDYLGIAKEYEEIGASAISVLTEPDYFLGNNQYLQDIAQHVQIPVLRKDFVIDEYMIYEAKVLGADAILLICSLLDEETLNEYIQIAHQLGLSCLVEAHDEEEIDKAMRCHARVIGVNNRNLKNFEVDIHHSIALRQLVDPAIIFISESGMRTYQDIQCLYENQVDAVLIGETFMRAENKRAVFEQLRGLV